MDLIVNVRLNLRFAKELQSKRDPNLCLGRVTIHGPLDLDDPLSAQADQVSERLSPDSSIPESPNRSNSLPPIVAPAVTIKDFSYLQRPEIYHSLPPLDLSTSSSHYPSSTPIPIHLTSSDFRSAAIAAAYQLCAFSNLSFKTIFSLIYTRLTCLILINALAFAAEESKALEDLNSPLYRDTATGAHILPWELRVLAVRLQGIGYGDLKQGVAGYYDLARDARKAFTESMDRERNVWKERLADLGVRVGNALVEMGDFVSALRHFDSLRRPDGITDNMLNWRLALLHLRLGNAGASRKHVEAAETEMEEETEKSHVAVLWPLLHMAERNYKTAAGKWNLLSKISGSDLAAQNLAVCLLYTSHSTQTHLD